MPKPIKRKSKPPVKPVAKPVVRTPADPREVCRCKRQELAVGISRALAALIHRSFPVQRDESTGRHVVRFASHDVPGDMAEAVRTIATGLIRYQKAWARELRRAGKQLEETTNG